jgi:hypothetical protein
MYKFSLSYFLWGRSRRPTRVNKTVMLMQADSLQDAYDRIKKLYPSYKINCCWRMWEAA